MGDAGSVRGKAAGSAAGRAETNASAGSPVQQARQNRSLRLLARLGLVSRAVFYLVLGYLSAAVAGGWDRHRRQANANGALGAVAQGGVGRAALALAAVGLVAFGGMRIAGALGDHSPTRLRRLSTAGQGVIQLAMAAAAVMFLLGRRQTGSEQQQRSTIARLLSEPSGRLVVAAIGVVVLGVCLWQFWVAASSGFADSLRTEQMSPRTRSVAWLVGATGIAARAAIMAPIGIFLLLAALSDQPREARGLDAYLAQLTTAPGGRALVWVMTGGFTAFAAYGVLEARYRKVQAGD